jgi:hypothetical protein
VGIDVDTAERRHHRAGGEDERHRYRDRDAEHGEQDEHGNRERDHLPLLEVGREDRIEVVLDRRLPGHVRRYPGRARQSSEEIVGVALRLRELERRDDVAVQEVPACGNQAAGARGRDHVRSAVDRDLKPRHPRPVEPVPDPQNDRERPIAALAEVALEDRPRALGIGPGHRELVREQRAEAAEGEAAPEQQHQPDGQDRPPKAQHQASPTFHASCLRSASSHPS